MANFQIKHRYTGEVLFACDAKDMRRAVEEAARSGSYLTGADLTGAYLSGADLTGADLTGADLTGAYLTGAYLSGAYLSGAYLTGADLTGADLTGAYLSGAYLSGAYLSGAYGINKHLTTPLFTLYDQPGAIRAYKLVGPNGEGPWQGGIVYAIGSDYSVTADTDEYSQCGAGINVATLDWVMREWREGYRILVVEFTAADIACIPIGSNGKFRLHRCRVVAEKDLVEIGLLAAEEEKKGKA